MSACKGLFDSTTVCTLGASAAIRVFVRDAASDALIPPDGGTTLILRDGAFVDSTTWPRAGGPWPEGVPLTSYGAIERPGTYDVTVRHPGYAEWNTTGIRVREGECGVRTVTLTARLQSPAAAP
ncbi:MAG: hypothetical protein C0503_01535 [Gemmatimonas sp.]|nr:hypothetical protein [Gemmatimonas sp.]